MTIIRKRENKSVYIRNVLSVYTCKAGFLLARDFIRHRLISPVIDGFHCVIVREYHALSCNLFHYECFKGISLFDVVELFKSHAALITLVDFLNIVLKTAER